jgi:two-component sensor histidine kinase
MPFSRLSPAVKQSIRVDLLKIVIAALASMFLITAGSTIWNAWSQRKLAEAEMTRTVHAISVGIDDSLLMTIAALEGVAAALVEESRVETLYAIALAVKAKRPEWSEVMLHNAAGEPIFTTALPLGSSVSQTGPRALWVKEAMTKDGHQISHLMHSHIANADVAAVFHRGITKEGTRFGLSVLITADKWTRLLQELPMPAGWVAGIIDRNGIVIAGTRRASEAVGKRAPEWILDAVRSASDGHAVGPAFEGEQLSVAYTRSNVSGWTIAFAAPASSMEAPLRQALIVAVAGNGLALGIGLLLVLTFARRLFRSLDWLARTADAMIVPSSSVSAAPSPMAREVDAVHAAIRRVGTHFTAADKRQRTSMRELQHRVGNELQAVMSLIAMAGKGSQSEECRHVLHDLQGRIDVLCRAHARLGGGGDSETVELGAFLRDVCIHAIALYGCRADGRIAFQAHTGQVQVGHDIAVSLGLITNEFVTNSAKHAFPRMPGTISLELKVLGAQQISLTLSDDGVGIPCQNARSSGLQLIAGLAEHLGAHAEWGVGAGTSLRLQLSDSVAPVQKAAEHRENTQDPTATAGALSRA